MRCGAVRELADARTDVGRGSSDVSSPNQSNKKPRDMRGFEAYGPGDYLPLESNRDPLHVRRQGLVTARIRAVVGPCDGVIVETQLVGWYRGLNRSEPYLLHPGKVGIRLHAYPEGKLSIARVITK